MKRIKAAWLAMPVFVVSFFILAAVIMMIVTGQGGEGKEPARVTEASSDAVYTEYPEKWQEGTITYNGRSYTYNRDNKIYLLMGIDKDEKVDVKEGAGTGGGRSDAMFLLIANRKSKKLSVVSINRNTMTKVEVYSENGKRIGNYTLPICLQHAYGDGGKSSCNRSVKAVSYLFRDLPISGYLALNMAGIAPMNDAAGGVSVTVLEDLEDVSAGVSLTQGEYRTLTGKEAGVYLRSRDLEQFDSATKRLRRQEQYLGVLIRQLQEIISGDKAKANEIFGLLGDYLVTNVDAATILSEWAEYSFQDEIRTVPGRMVQGESYEEYQVDQKALYSLIMEVFYTEKED